MYIGGGIFGTILVIALIVYFLIAYIALQRQQIKTGPWFLCLPLLIPGADGAPARVLLRKS